MVQCCADGSPRKTSHDTDNFEDIEHQEHRSPRWKSGQQPTGARSNLSEAWRTRPIFKLLVVMTVAGAAIALATTFLGGGTNAARK